MTGPRITQGEQFDPQLGVNSQLAHEEWSEFLNNRRQMVDEILGRLNLSGQLHPADTPAFTPHPVAEDAHALSKAQELSEPLMDEQELEKLLGAARFYGIEGAEKIPPDRLKMIVAERRRSVQPKDPTSWGMFVPEAIAALGLGTTEGLVKAANTTPLIGDALAKFGVRSWANKRLGELSEGVRASMTAEEAGGFDRGTGIANFIGYAMAYEAAGGALNRTGLGAKIAGSNYLPPLMKGALYGGLSTAMIEGRGLYQGDREREHALDAIVLGSGVGAASEILNPLLSKVMGRIQDSFASRLNGARRWWKMRGVIDTEFAPHTGETSQAEIVRDLEVGQPQITARLGTGGEPSGTGTPLQLQPGPTPQGLIPSNRPAVTGPISEGPTGLLPSGPRGLLPSGPVTPLQAETGLLPAGQLVLPAGPTVTPPVQIGAGAETGITTPLMAQPEHLLSRTERDYIANQVPPEVANVLPAVGARIGDVLSVAGEHTPAVQAALGDLGYAGIQAPTGETVNFRALHQITSPAEAASEGATLSKHVTLMESPALPEMAGQAKFDHADVAKAALITNPGSISVIKNIGDVGKAVRELVQAQSSGKLMPHTFRVVERPVGEGLPVQRDLLVTDGLPITNKRVDQYKQFGMFEGQTVTTNGAQVHLVNPAAPDALATVRDIHDGTEFQVRADLITPGNSSEPMTVSEAPSIYDEVRNKVLAELGEAASKSGFALPDWLSPEASTQIPRILDETLDGMNLAPANRRAVEAYFNARRVQEYRNLAPVEQAELEVARAEANRAVVYHYGTYEGGKGNAFFSSTRESGTLGSGLYFATSPENLGDIVPSLQRGQVEPGTALREFRIAENARIFDLSAPVNPQELETMVSQLADEDFAQEIRDAYESGEIKTNYQLYNWGREMEDLPGMSDEVNFTLGEMGYQGVRTPYEINIFPGHEEALVQPAGAPAELPAAPGISLIPMEEIAETKGFKYLPAPGSAGGTLVDAFSDLRVPVDTPESGVEFLRNFTRDLPEINLPGDVPIEVMPTDPNAALPNSQLQPVSEGLENELANLQEHTQYLQEQVNDAYINMAERQALEAQSGAPGRFGTGGFGPPRLPPVEQGPMGWSYNPELGPGPTTLGAQIQAMKERGIRLRDLSDFDRASRVWDGLYRQWMEPMRMVAIHVEREFTELGLTEGTLYKDFQDLDAAVNRMRDRMNPLIQESVGWLSGFRRLYRRAGAVVDVEGIPNWNDKLRRMQQLGYTQEEMDAQAAIRPFYDKLHGIKGGGGYIFDYLPRVRLAMNMGSQTPYEDALGHLPEEVRFFADFARTGNLQPRQVDIASMTMRWIRAFHFQREVGPIYERVVARWQDPRIPDSIKEPVLTWLEGIRTGHHPGKDATVAAVTKMLRPLGIDEADVHQFVGSMISNMYRAQLGGRPDLIFRDSIQPWWTGTHIGFKHVAASYARAARGGLPEMTQRALQGGWLELNMPPTPGSEPFTYPLVGQGGTPMLSPAAAARRETLARIGDAIYDLTPRRFRFGIQASGLDPMLPYAKLQTLNKVISGDAGWKAASDALTAYEAKLGNPSTDLDEARATLMKDSRARIFPSPVRNEFLRQVDAGNFDEAANVMGREAANLQMRPGAREQPVGIQRAGTWGRIGMMFGNFSQQFIGQVKERLLSDIPLQEKAAFLLRNGIVSSAIGAAAAYTGWKKLNSWQWYNAMTFSGSPAFQGTMERVQAVTGSIAAGLGQNVSPEQRFAMAQAQRQGIVPAALSGSFPYSSTIRNAGNFLDAISGADPVGTALQQLITGQSGNAAAFQNLMQDIPLQPGAVLNQPFLTPPQTNPLVEQKGRRNWMVDGVSDTSRMRTDSIKGYPVYDSSNRYPDGRSATHRLDVPSGRMPGETWEQYENRVNAKSPNQFSPSVQNVTNDPMELDPDVRGPLMGLIGTAERQNIVLRVGETIRPQERQEWLFKQGRSIPGRIVTWTLTSNHTTRRAADLIVANQHPHDQQAGYAWIQENAPRFGFSVMGASDPGHIAMPMAGGSQVLPQPGGIDLGFRTTTQHVTGAGAMQ